MKTDYFCGMDAQGEIVPGTLAHTWDGCRAKAQSKPQVVGVAHLNVNLERAHADPDSWRRTKEVFRWEGLTA